MSNAIIFVNQSYEVKNSYVACLTSIFDIKLSYAQLSEK